MFKYLIILSLTLTITLAKTKTVQNKTNIDEIKKILEEHEQKIVKVNKSKVNPVKITGYEKAKLTPILPPEKSDEPKIITADLVKYWAFEIQRSLLEMEAKVVRRDELLKGFKDFKMELRNGAKIVDKMAKSLEELLTKRVKAAEEIMKKAEEIATPKLVPPSDYIFDTSVDLDRTKKKPPSYEMGKHEMRYFCRNRQKTKLQPSKHFGTSVSFEKTSVHVAAEVFDCDERVTPHLHWSEGLLSTFQKNYAQDVTTEFQYFCSASGFIRHYPAALWNDMSKQEYDPEADIYDCRLRPWYVGAQGAPRDVLVLLDASGSMNNSSNRYIGQQFTMALLNALTDDDQVNVLRFSVGLFSPINCFEDRLVPANHINTAAIMSSLGTFPMHNTTWLSDVLEDAVRLLQRQRGTHDRPPSCQQAIILLSDSIYDNFTDLIMRLDPHGKIRLFTLWLHDPNGLRDSTYAYGESLSCYRDGYFAELISHAYVTEQVMRILRVLERPLVAQRKDRLRVFSDVYAHIEDPRRGEQQWKNKENAEQLYRYRQLRLDKKKLLSPEQLEKDHFHQTSLQKYGWYYEGDDVHYKLMISVSVPVFEHTTVENITIQLFEEKQRNATRTYPVNRLLGVAGVDIPIDHLKLLLPYHEVGGGGSLYIVDHRGNIVLHHNLKPTFDGDILKPGYRTVDFLDLEQPANEHYPRHYPADWLKFRRTFLIDKESGNMTMYAKDIFEHDLRAHMEMREYHWKRVMNHYTAVISLPPYGREHIVPETTFTKELAEQALKTLARTDFAVHPDWLYCRHVEPHFDTREAEVLHFIRRRCDEPNFAMKKLKYDFSPIPPTLLEKNYHCDEGLMAKLCKEAIATDKWAREHEQPNTERDCSTCELGSTTAFFVSESGLTRWQQYHATSQHEAPVSGAVWAEGPTEPWYRRAVARPQRMLIHLPLAPVRRLRNTFNNPPPLGVKSEWLTAARALTTDKGLIGVAGYHFYPQHLIDLLISVTNFPCYEEDKSRCKPQCNDTWNCVLVDEFGWIVARDINGSFSDFSNEEAREHLASLHPAAMSALLQAGVYQLNWIHDYQSVCIAPWDSSAVTLIPSLLLSFWRSIKLIFHVTKELITLITILSSTTTVSAETAKEKALRRENIRKAYEADRISNLYDHRVLINKTVFAACDRSRPIYILQQTDKAMNALSRTPKPSELLDCSWPVVGATLPETNLLLLALYNCDVPYTGRAVPNPLINQPYLEVDNPYVMGMKQSAASNLACWRNRVPLPGRPPTTACYPHNYSQEFGYRQCGAWLPDPEKPDTAPKLETSYLPLLLLAQILLIV